MTDLSALIGLFQVTGVPLPGCSMSDEEALRYARKNFPNGNFCLVRDWIWLDIETTDTQRHALEKTQRQPALIYAHQVVFDSERRWDVGDFVSCISSARDFISERSILCTCYWGPELVSLPAPIPFHA